MISQGQIAHIAHTDPRLYEVLVALINNHNNLALYHGIDTSGQVPAPAKVGTLTVTAANGVFRATIIDKSTVRKGITYFLEHDTDPNFSHPVTVWLGPSRDWLEFLGSGTFYFRAYSQYPFSQPSGLVYSGGVSGGGAIAGPAPLPEQGSGTNPTLPGTGYGRLPRQPSPVRAQLD